jgi:hypothetical protein
VGESHKGGKRREESGEGCFMVEEQGRGNLSSRLLVQGDDESPNGRFMVGDGSGRGRAEGWGRGEWPGI